MVGKSLEGCWRVVRGWRFAGEKTRSKSSCGEGSPEPLQAVVKHEQLRSNFLRRIVDYKKLQKATCLGEYSHAGHGFKYYK